MIVGHSSAKAFLALVALLLVAFCSQPVFAQDDPANGEPDPVKIFERGQDAHAKNDYKKAIELYDAAIKIKPEFPEAEFQRAMALLATKQTTEAIEGFNRAVALRPDWAIAYSKFGRALAIAGGDDVNAERILRRAIELDSKDVHSLESLAELRAKHRDFNEALKLMQAATSLSGADNLTWRRRASIESSSGDKAAALASLNRALLLNPGEEGAYRDRAVLHLAMNDNEAALSDLRNYERGASALTEFPVGFELAQLYARAGKTDESLRVLHHLNEEARSHPEVIALRAEITGGDGSSAEERAAMEQMLGRDPQNASLLARLGNAYRRVDPLKSQDYYYRALQIEPKNAKYATGYAAALVQARKFAEAETVLRRVLAVTPDDYTAHANLALALYEMKRFAEALPEYEWLAKAKPEIPATYFFIAIAHDNLAEYPEALDAYQRFLAHADPATNKLEIDKVNLRLPTLRAQVQRGQGVKKKNP
jgi:tetratricopeptide (TPR) repeat protein